MIKMEARECALGVRAKQSSQPALYLGGHTCSVTEAQQRQLHSASPGEATENVCLWGSSPHHHHLTETRD